MSIQWRKSTRSHNADIGTCVEVADFGPDIGVRDSKDPGGPVLRFSRRELAKLFSSV